MRLSVSRCTRVQLALAALPDGTPPVRTDGVLSRLILGLKPSQPYDITVLKLLEPRSQRR